MRPVLTVVDRLAALLLGLALLAAGAGMLIWRTGLIPHAPDTITAPGLVTATGSAWWPWVSTAAGVGLVLVGMRWLLSHGPTERARKLALSGSGRAGRLSADLGSLADAAAANLASHPAVRSAKATAVIRSGAPCIDMDATADSADTLAEAARAADDIAVTATTMLGQPIAVRTHLRVDTKRSPRRQLA